MWRAVDESLNRVVAIKLLHPWVAQATRGGSGSGARRPRWAASSTRTSSQVLEFNDTAERPYLVQEYCPGGTLARAGRRRPDAVGPGPRAGPADRRRRSRTRTGTASSTAT